MDVLIYEDKVTDLNWMIHLHTIIFLIWQIHLHILSFWQEKLCKILMA